MDAVDQSLTRPLYLRELTDLMQCGSLSGSAMSRLARRSNGARAAMIVSRCANVMIRVCERTLPTIADSECHNGANCRNLRVFPDGQLRNF
jgi:hypothetical protein